MPGERLAVHPPLVFAQRLRSDALVEFVGIGEPGGEDLVKGREGIGGRLGTQPQAHDLRPVRRGRRERNVRPPLFRSSRD